MSFHSAYMCYRLLCEYFKRSEQQGATSLLPSALNNMATMISTNFQAIIQNYVIYLNRRMWISSPVAKLL